jgi:hypothetical protein
MSFDFKTKIDNLESVPDQFRGLYVPLPEDQGVGFTYHPEFSSHVNGLTTALEKERKANKEVRAQIAAWKALGDTPEVISQKLTELQEAAAKGKENQPNWDKLKGDLEAGYSKKLSEKDKEISTMRATVERHLVDNEATLALAEAKGSVALLLPHVKQFTRVIEENGVYVVRVIDKDGDPRGNHSGGFMTIKDLVAEMKSSDVFGRAFEASGNTGGGKPPVKSGGTPAGTNHRENMSPMDRIRAGLQKNRKAS